MLFDPYSITNIKCIIFLKIEKIKKVVVAKLYYINIYFEKKLKYDRRFSISIQKLLQALN